MQNRSLPARFAAAFLIIIIGFGCTKIDTTTLGSDLVTVDNINTFGDTLDVNATQGYFLNDSTLVGKRENYAIGNITTDPLFGTTTAEIYVQFKPTFYPFHFGFPGDTVKNSLSPFAGLDSMVVCLSYKGAWGDTSATAIPQKFEVRSISDPAFMEKTDTVRQLNYRPTVSGDVLGSAFITPEIVKRKTYLAGRRDSVENQIRIPLDNGPAATAFKNYLYEMQDSSASGTNNGFNNDSAFRTRFHGLAITVTGPGNTVYYVNIAEAKSRLEVFLHKTKNGVRDTGYQALQMYPSQVASTRASSSANYIKRDYTGAPAAVPSATDIYMQTAPGTYANITVPQLSNYTNRIIHRAYLVAEQTPFSFGTDNIYTSPRYLYLDLKDTVTATPQRYKPLYFDLNFNIPYNPDAAGLNELYHPFPAQNVDVDHFDGIAKERFDATGTKFTRYEINLTRYVQHIVSNGYRNYEMRLYAPYNYHYPQYSGTKYLIPFYNPVALGRVRLGSGTNAAHKMKLIVIYSKL